MEDVGKSPPASAIAVADSSSFNQLDGWIETLMQCKQLSELDVQRLCEKVRLWRGIMMIGSGVPVEFRREFVYWLAFNSLTL